MTKQIVITVNADGSVTLENTTGDVLHVTLAIEGGDEYYRELLDGRTAEILQASTLFDAGSLFETSE